VVARAARNAGMTYPVTYEGGSLPLSHARATATLGKYEVVFEQSGHRIVVPVKNVTGISCGSESRSRPGAAVLGVLPLVHYGASEDYYIGVTWTDDARVGRPAEVLLRVGKSEYRALVGALEAATGVKAVDPNRVPVVVRYGL
jgi:hypothetical protein